MRSGGCTVQHTLTAEAAGVVKHAVAVARQRGHAQVTPLHVAATLLSPGGTTLLRRACLKSHPHSTSHPLQCRALELCFKVALNRLPTTAGSVVQPSLSNSLVAVLKRAQANQRRGCVEQQQQPLLGVKVEIEQLIISILDDPSVSRVMREAGFSSTFAKNKLEEESACLNFSSSSSLENQNSTEICRSSAAKIKGIMAEAVDLAGGVIYSQSSVGNHSSRFNFFDSPGFDRFNGGVKNDDVESVLAVLLGQKTRRMNSVIVGDCFLLTENVMRDVMSRIGRGDVPDPLKAVRFVTPHFNSLAFGMPLGREVVEQKLAELRRGINNCLVGGSAIVYVGDLRWAVDEGINRNMVNGGGHGYCAVDHIRMELGRILSCGAENRRVWLMATATYETYMKCQKGQPSLETQWGLQAVPVPSGGLSLTLQPSSANQVEGKISGTRSDVLIPIPQNIMSWQAPPIKTIDLDDEPVEKPNCCSECSAKFEQEAEEKKLSSTASQLPLWLQQCSNNNNAIKSATAQLEELRQKWEQICRSKHSHWEQRRRSAFEIPHYAAPVSGVNSGPCPSWWRGPQSHGYGSGVLCNSPACSHQTNVGDSSIDSVEESSRFDNVETTLALGLADSTSQESPTPVQADQDDLEGMTKMLAQRIPWQTEANAGAIVSAVLRSRSGGVRRENGIKGDTCRVLALGPDRMGKRKTAQALAEIMFGSQDRVVCFTGKYDLDRLRLNPNCVVLVEDIERAEGAFMEMLMETLETGRIMDSNGREVKLSNAIFFLTSIVGTNCFAHCPSYQFDEDALIKHIEHPSWGLKLVLQEDQEKVGLAKLGNCSFKRKPEWDSVEVSQREKRNRPSLVLDLNLETDEQAGGIEMGEKRDHNALSDQIRGCLSEQLMKSIDKCLVFLPFDFSQFAEKIVDKLHESYQRATNGRGLFDVESSAVERLVSCCWELAPLGTTTFEKWAEQIFEVWLARIQSTHTLTSQTIVKLSATESSNAHSFYDNSHLPTRFEVYSCNNHARFSYSA